MDATDTGVEPDIATTGHSLSRPVKTFLKQKTVLMHSSFTQKYWHTRFWSSRYAGAYDNEIVSEDGRMAEIAETIYSNYLKSF